MFFFFQDFVFIIIFGSPSRFLGFPSGSDGKESTCNAGRPGFDPWVGKIPLKEGMATHSSILAWRILWTRERRGYSPWGHKESDTTETT